MLAAASSAILNARFEEAQDPRGPMASKSSWCRISATLPVASHATSAQVAWMTRVAAGDPPRFGRPVGLNLLENDAEAMFAVASAAGADFVRIKVYVGAMMTPFGIESGAGLRGDPRAERLRRQRYRDLRRRSRPYRRPAGERRIRRGRAFAIRLGGADGLVLTGKSYQQTLEFIEVARKLFGARADPCRRRRHRRKFRRGRASRRRRHRQLLAQGFRRRLREACARESRGLHGRGQARSRAMGAVRDSERSRRRSGVRSEDESHAASSFKDMRAAVLAVGSSCAGRRG